MSIILCRHNMPASMCSDCRVPAETVQQGADLIKDIIAGECKCASWDESCVFCPPKRRAMLVKRYEDRKAKQERHKQPVLVKEAKLAPKKVYQFQDRRLENARRLYNAKYRKRLSPNQFKDMMLNYGKELAKKESN